MSKYSRINNKCNPELGKEICLFEKKNDFLPNYLPTRSFRAYYLYFYLEIHH